MLQRVGQVAHPRGGDREQLARPRSARSQIELQLPGRHPLPGRGLQGLQLGLVVRQPQVLYLPRPALRGPHKAGSVSAFEAR